MSVDTCGHWITEFKQHWNTSLHSQEDLSFYVISACLSLDTETNLKLALLKLKVSFQRCRFSPEERILFSTSIRLTWMSSRLCKYLFICCCIFLWVKERSLKLHCLNLLLSYVCGCVITRDRLSEREGKEEDVLPWQHTNKVKISFTLSCDTIHSLLSNKQPGEIWSNLAKQACSFSWLNEHACCQ